MGKNWPRKQMVGHGCFQWIQNRYLDSSDLIGIYMVCEWQLSVLRRRRYRSTQAAALQYFWTHSWQVNTRELSQCYPYQPWSCCLLRLSDWAIIICGHDLVYVPLHHIPGQIVIHQWIMRYAYSTRPHWPKSSWAGWFAGTAYLLKSVVWAIRPYISAFPWMHYKIAKFDVVLYVQASWQPLEGLSNIYVKLLRTIAKATSWVVK